jgi:beta-mannanase
MRRLKNLSLTAMASAAVMVLALLPVGAITGDNRPVPIEGGLIFGAYDPQGDFVDDPNSKIEHLFLPWEDVDLSTLAAADIYAQERGRTLLVTIEPWTWSTDRRIAPKQLQDGIASDGYAGNIAAICRILAGFQTPTTVRFAHEMEDESGRFIWANWEPADYIAAYRKVVSDCRAIAPNLAFIWSPKGELSLGAYYPGDDVVDVIGLSVFGLQAYDNLRWQRDMSFADLLRPGYGEAAKFGKPIYVAEMAYSGDAEYVESWKNTVLEKREEFPLLMGVIYFNDRDVVAWPLGLGVPDWRVTSNIVGTRP